MYMCMSVCAFLSACVSVFLCKSARCCMCMCCCLCVCVCICICTLVSVYWHVYLYVALYLCACVCVRACSCVCVYICESLYPPPPPPAELDGNYSIPSVLDKANQPVAIPSSIPFITPICVGPNMSPRLYYVR